ncbi:MAG: OmpA family protein [Enterobacterales bacterium]|nr:OmpA family protein [Enterobacterales bacterium]
MRRIRNNVDFDDQATDRWLISYADFITLLFAFFVVLYSISQVNASKYKILSQTLEGVFDQQTSGPEIISIGEPTKSLTPVTGDQEQNIDSPEKETEAPAVEEANLASVEEFKDLQKGLEASLGDLIDQDLAEIKTDKNWINIVLKSALLFPSGSDVLNTESDPLMEEVAKHLNDNQQLILVHGHTDNIPIETEKFPSNWELSSARAVAVVRKLQKYKVQPNRLSVQGHGEFQPIEDNSTVEGRRENRRVVISISRKQRVEPIVKDVKDASQLDDTITKETEKEQEPKYKIIKLPGGGILIRGANDKAKKSDQEGQ